jgi:alpha-L-arabinofuranosidase
VLKANEFNTFKLKADGKNIELYINGDLVQKAEVPKFPSFKSATAVDGDSIIVKIVNISPDPDDIAISLDCDVEGEYEADILHADPFAENSFDSLLAKDVSLRLSGASRSFTYPAKEFSVSVLRLKRSS